MNESVEPCEDFYEFACGMFETNYPFYSDTNENSWFTIISLKLKHIVKSKWAIKLFLLKTIKIKRTHVFH